MGNEEARFCGGEGRHITFQDMAPSVGHGKPGKKQKAEQQEMILLGEEFEQERRLEVNDSHWYCPIIKLASEGRRRAETQGQKLSHKKPGSLCVCLDMRLRTCVDLTVMRSVYVCTYVQV